MRKHKIEKLIWREVAWQRQFDLTAVWEAFSHLAALSPRGAVIRAGLAALCEDKTGTETVLQVVLGPAHAPAPIPSDLPDPHATWLQAILGDVGKAAAESRKNVREKAEQYVFLADVRIGASGNGALQRIRSLSSALRTLASAGVRIHDEEAAPGRLNSAHVPWHFPLQLSAKELAGFLLLPVEMYIDELQDYLSLPTDLSDALAQARGLGLGLTLAHQYFDQLPPGIRSGINANTRSKIFFGLNAADAKTAAAMAPELTAEDFMGLPRYQVYASFQCGGKSTGWVQGRTLPPPPAIRDAATVSGEYEDRWFFEVDLDTESPANVIEKCQRYHQYYRSGLEQKASGVFPLTVWVVPDKKRRERLSAHIRDAFAKQPRLFAVITVEELERLIRDGGDSGALC